ncbi:uncharacterized protein LOC114258358 isoform X1 [Camellia sinensis]|uniref:uncharacterized protein LOC114258358 isoform X1 n=2 Tax=Camellia sinensis TaxID=4442 RepID=UPI001036A4FA|nr:uncharacterized protein LOC114258358 isoform X1 [Camellia sinensis]
MYNIYVPNPVLVIIDVEPKEMGIPTKAYYAVEEVKENATQKSQKVFVHVPSEIAAHDVQKLLFCCLILLLSSVLFLTVTVRSPIFKAVPRKRFHNVVVKNGLGLTVACMAMSSATGCPADETNLTGVGEIRLIPDLSTKCIIPW